MDGDARLNFQSVTGASPEEAAKYLQASNGDIDMAIVQYLEDQEAGVVEPSAETNSVAAGGAPPGAAVDSIVGDIHSRMEDDVSKGGGKGLGKAGGKMGKPEGTAVAIVFFSDGFMVDDEFDPEPPEPEAEAAAPAPKRKGMMGLSDLAKDPRGQMKMPKLPKLKPLRAYDAPGSKEFLDDVKAGKVPEEFKKRDENGKPVPVSIGIEDARPRSYEELSRAIKEMEALQRQEESENPKPKAGPTLFAGAGNSLSSSSSAATAPAAKAGGTGQAAPELVALLSRPVPQADESKPCANIQLRLASGSAKVRLNKDHTVSDLWRLVAEKMGVDAFRTSSNHQLIAGFPPKPLSDLNATIAAADLANASVQHKCQ